MAKRKVRVVPPPPASSPAAARSYWTDGKEARILYTTPGYQLIALDAQNRATHLQLRQQWRGGFEGR